MVILIWLNYMVNTLSCLKDLSGERDRSKKSPGADSGASV